MREVSRKSADDPHLVGGDCRRRTLDVSILSLIFPNDGGPGPERQPDEVLGVALLRWIAPVAYFGRDDAEELARQGHHVPLLVPARTKLSVDGLRKDVEGARVACAACLIEGEGHGSFILGSARFHPFPLGGTSQALPGSTLGGGVHPPSTSHVPALGATKHRRNGSSMRTTVLDPGLHRVPAFAAGAHTGPRGHTSRVSVRAR